MLSDGRQVREGALLEADVCIVGAGAAGITIARQLSGGGLDVVMLESGGVVADAETQALYAGRIFGRAYFRLDESRTRRFGGSTHCWSGMCRPLASHDFEARDWVPDSGWPIDYAALLPYYRRAQRVCRLDEFEYGAERWAVAGEPPLALDGDVFDHGVFQIAPTRFAAAYGDELQRARNVQVHLNANVVDIVATENGAAVERVAVKTLDGRSFSVRARSFVLATGGIENARLLLSSIGSHEKGLGNTHGAVGRYFMEHPHTVSGVWLPSSANPALGFYRARKVGGIHVSGVMTPSAQLQRDERILSFALFLAREAPLPEFEQPLARFLTEMDGGTEPAQRAIFFMNELEQAPNPASRVRLIPENDALGMPRVQLEWRLSAIDKRTLNRGHQRLAQSLALAGLGRLQVLVEEDDHTWPTELSGGRHHMGTTRMHTDPKRGVVDADCRVHGLANLFVAGSSVFPTSGAANPTLTLLALALRLSDHLGRSLA